MILRSALFGITCLLTALTTFAQAQTGGPSTRELERMNWMEYREWIPGKIQTVLVPLGTMEAHGVTANGADILAPVAIAKQIAPKVNAMIAPVIPYGVTGSLDAYPGSFTIPEDVYRPYVRAALLGFVKGKFKNLILINGHGGPQTAILSSLASDVGREAGVRVLVINWWQFTLDVATEVLGSEGGHAGDNETAFMQAIDPALVHKGRYTGPEMTTAYPAAGTWSAYPNPSAIGLYKAGQGYPLFDEAKAKIFFTRVNEKVAALIAETIKKWDLAGL
jgi:creatinine amidohydrolase